MHSAQCGTLSHAVSARVFGTCFAWNCVHGILLLSSRTCMYNELTSHILTCSMTTQRAVTIGTVLKSTCDEAGLVPASSEAAARTPSPLFPPRFTCTPCSPASCALRLFLSLALELLLSCALRLLLGPAPRLLLGLALRLLLGLAPRLLLGLALRPSASRLNFSSAARSAFSSASRSHKLRASPSFKLRASPSPRPRA